MICRYALLASSVLSSSLLFGTYTRSLDTKPDLDHERNEPWFTGSLLAPNGHTIPKGNVEVKPFVFASDGVGSKSYIWQTRATNRTRTINPVLTIGYGITDWWDFDVTFQGYYKERWDKHSFRRGDVLVDMGIQLLTERMHTPTPDLRLFLMESIPFGFYERLNPNKNGTDSSGSGSYETTYGFIIHKTFDTGRGHFFDFQASFGYTHGHRTFVESFNTYGGGYGTRGRIFPEGKWVALFSLQYMVTQNFSFALDIVGMSEQKAKFKGTTGTDVNGNPAKFDLQNAYQMSIAPGVEWNFSRRVGLIGGVWFSNFGGRSVDEFFSAVIGMNIRTY